jgi:hypothetical protein
VTSPYEVASLAEAAGMTRAEYREWVRGLRARPLAEKMAVARLADGPGDTEIREGNFKPPSDRHVESGDGLTREERFARVAEWLSQLGRKVEVADVTHTNKRVASDWLRSGGGEGFSFLDDLRAKQGSSRLSDPQAKAVLNCLRAELRGFRPAPVVTDSLPEIPAEVTDLLP